jgi:plasmid stabilization system protein ParE
MTRKVLITARAIQEAQGHHDWWADHRSTEQAARRYDKFLKGAKSLARDPERFALAAENDLFPYEIRQLSFGAGHKPTH